jgi:uncharacterized membrane protein
MSSEASMEEIFRITASNVALITEFIAIAMIVIGVVEGLVKLAILASTKFTSIRAKREIFIQFGAWIILALQFALAADIVRTAIAPTWSQIGQLAAIAAIRTGLNYFLERDLEAFAEERDTEKARREPPLAG